MILRRIYRSLILPIFIWARKRSFPGFKGVSVYHVIRFVINESTKDDITTRANSIAFTFFLSLFPLIIFVFTLIPLLPIRFDFLEVLEDYGRNALPTAAFEYLFQIVEGVISIRRSGLLSLGFFMAFFFSSNGMLMLMNGFDKSYDLTFKKRNFIKARLVAVALTTVIALLFIFSIVLIVFGNQLISQIFSMYDLGIFSTYVLQFFRYGMVIVIIYTTISLIYIYGPSMYRRFPYFNIGATLATTLSILSSVLFAYFINNFGRYNEIYGSIGALIVLLLWIQINAFIILIGFELNASIQVHNDRLILGKK